MNEDQLKIIYRCDGACCVELRLWINRKTPVDIIVFGYGKDLEEAEQHALSRADQELISYG